MLAKAICDLCKEDIVEVTDTRYLGRWTLHAKCYHIMVKRLGHLEDILLSPQDEFDEYLDENEILHIMFRRQDDDILGIAKE